MTPLDLKAERLNRGKNVLELATEIGVRPHVLRRAEAGERLAPENAYKIATFYGYKVTDLWPVEAPAGEAA